MEIDFNLNNQKLNFQPINHWGPPNELNSEIKEHISYLPFNKLDKLGKHNELL